MHRILIAVLDDGRDVAARTERARALEASLAMPVTLLDIDVVRAAPGVAFALLEHCPDVIVAVGYKPADVLALGQLACPVLWDMGEVVEAEVASWLAQQSSRRTLRAALAAASGFIDVPESVAFRIEDELKLGITSHRLPSALAAVAKRTIVIIGAGLGNMIYAGSMLRWLSERLKAPLDLVIHNRFDDAVSLFARAPWLNAVYPGFEYLTGRHYHLAVSAVTAGSLRPPFTADRFLWVDQERDYNIEGRFIHETRLNFLGLAEYFDEDPALLSDIPAPFIRDMEYRHPGGRVVGVASGKKGAAWANREWPHMERLVERLKQEGWDLRSFGLPDEYVPDARNLTGIPMRRALEEIGKCSFFISHDGGICHMAEAIGVPTLWLFGPASAVKNGPVYRHSRILSSWRACGPCIYKADWLRCDKPLCMQDITVDLVVQMLEALYAEVKENGYAPVLAPTDTILQRHEVEALIRPGPKSTQENSLRERTSLVSHSASAMERLTLALLEKGDLVGAATMADSLRVQYPQSSLGQTISVVIAQAFPGSTSVRDLGGVPPAELESSSFSELLDGTVVLSEAEKGVLLRAVARYLLQKGDKRRLAMFLRAAIARKPFAAGRLDLIHRLATVLEAPGLASLEAESSADIECYSRPHWNMRSVRDTPVVDQLDAYASRLAKLLDLSPEEIRSHSFTPHRARAQAGVPPHSTPLHLGRYQFVLHQRSIVLALVPHVMVKNAVPGSTSSLVLLHMARLAMIGFRPVVVTVGFGDIADGWTMRDSVTFIQAHRRWKASNWASLVEAYPADLIIAYGGIANELDVPSSLKSDLVPVTVDGLFDPTGIYASFSSTESWAPIPPQPADEGNEIAISADTVSEALFVLPDRSPSPAAAPLSAIVLLNDARDFMALVTLVTSVPSVEFLVLTALKHRGVEKNFHTVSPSEISSSAWREAAMLIQFSTRNVALAAESIIWIERAGCLIAAGQSTSNSGLSRHYWKIGNPENSADWIKAVQGVASRVAMSRMVLMSD